MTEKAGRAVSDADPQTDGAPSGLTLPEWLTTDLRISRADIRFESAPPPPSAPREPEAPEASNGNGAPGSATARAAPEERAAETQLLAGEPRQPESDDAPAVTAPETVLATQPSHDVPNASHNVFFDESHEAHEVTEAYGTFGAPSDFADTPASASAQEEEPHDEPPAHDESSDFEEPVESATLAPQALPDDDDLEADLARASIPYTRKRTSTFGWKRVVGLAAVALAVLSLSRACMHRTDHVAHAVLLPVAPKAATTAAQVEIPAAPTEEPATAEPVATDDALAGSAKGFSGRRETAPSAPPEAPDMTPSYGPSVARFPDLPQSILSELAKPFESAPEPNQSSTAETH